MKLCTFQKGLSTRLGVRRDEESIVDINLAYASLLAEEGEPKASSLADVMIPPSMIPFIEGGKSSLKAARKALDYGTSCPENETFVLRIADIRIMAPISRPSKILCAAVSRKDTWDRAIKPPDPRPTYFAKLPSCIAGPYDPIEIPDIGVVGPEVEVAAVLAKRGKNIPIEDIDDYIFGYTIHNDITAHELRKKSEWITVVRENGTQERLTYQGRYKCFDTFAPMGPWLVTKDEFGDINRRGLSMVSRLNGSIVQSGTTADTVFPFSRFIQYLSEAHTLEPGDIVSGGTVLPAPGWTMMTIDLRKIGGVLESEVEGIGTMRNPLRPV